MEKQKEDKTKGKWTPTSGMCPLQYRKEKQISKHTCLLRPMTLVALVHHVDFPVNLTRTHLRDCPMVIRHVVMWVLRHHSFVRPNAVMDVIVVIRMIFVSSVSFVNTVRDDLYGNYHADRHPHRDLS